MTIDMTHFEDLRSAILSAGAENVVKIKKEIGEAIARYDYAAQKGEDPMGGWYLYLDALCDMRLGACSWNGGAVHVMAICDLNLLMDWYVALADVARSVNRRAKDGRGGCNVHKLAVLSDFVAGKANEIDKITRNGNRYALYLQERTGQIMRMSQDGLWSPIDKIEAFRG